MFETVFNFEEFTLSALVDIGLVSVIVYYFYKAISKTRALPVFLGVVLIIILTMITSYLRLDTLSFLLGRILELLFFAVVILFPSEIRRALYNIGQRVMVIERKGVKKSSLDIVVSAVRILAKKKTGAIIVLERNDRLSQLIDSGTQIQSQVDQGLILSIFHKNSPLHDGAMIIGNNKILSAACYVQSLSSEIPRGGKYGSRHRAALGISEQSDAAVVVVSEESGHISLAYNSAIKNNLKADHLTTRLYRIFKNEN